MGKSRFTFKQFSIAQDRCAMKVGTDGVALGAWAPVDGVRRILDIGTGTGLIALMLAQRSVPECEIVAIELDHDAALQAAENVANSPWSQRIRVVESALQKYQSDPFDLIVSNPPYFPHGQSFASLARQNARHTAMLTHQELLIHSLRLLAPNGNIAVILPVSEAQMLMKVAAVHGLYVVSLQRLIPRVGLAPNRFLLLLSRVKHQKIASDLVIYSGNGVYSESYGDMVKDFYLKL